MRKYLGWVSIGIIGVTFILLFLMRGKVSGFVGTNVLITGAILALLTALLSEKGKPKTTSITILGILVGGFIIYVIGLMYGGL
ncbi:hypothetical protein [Bacillus sp. 1NLA3E]|uniref:hypothetical protein n=1 Tax=Bacillus sp. 1NLA3E TaxID=666686 RepID=UPI000247EEBE|nr:hypothetical protein [Bacillus sp. 1NLA3E]AGK53670.1 hypothetical protein B1NLA3E_09560 [Bacillus sp. 1NLA3E]